MVKYTRQAPNLAKKLSYYYHFVHMVKLFVFASRPILPRRPSSLFSVPAYYNVLGHCLKKFEMILVVGVGEGELPRKF